MKINTAIFQKYIDEKYISVQKHPTADLFIYNYTQKAQFDRVPDEFYAWVLKTRDDLKSQFHMLQLQAEGTFKEISEATTTRKEFALESIKHSDLRAILFAMYDHKSVDDIIWRMLKPKAEKPYKEDIDA